MIASALSLVLSAAPTLLMSGDLPNPTTLQQKELEAVGVVTETSNGKKLTGASLQKVLEVLGQSAGPQGKDVPKAQKHSGHRKVVIAHARDGFEAVFSAAELDETVGSTRVLIVWAIDGKALDEKDGPFKLAVPSDHSPARSISQLDKIEVRAVTVNKP